MASGGAGLLPVGTGRPVTAVARTVSPLTARRRWGLWMIGRWPSFVLTDRGNACVPVTVPGGVTGDGRPPPRVDMPKPGRDPTAPLADCTLGNSVVANG